MPDMTIRATNATFESAAFGDYETGDAAYRAAILAALDIATNEVAAGKQSSIVQISVEEEPGRVTMRGAVSVATARLLI